MTFTPAQPGVFLTLHMLRTHVPGNLNRDDLGDPKTCVFGGTRRLRISSQCIKRAIRTGEVFARFAEEARNLFQAERMIRTRYLLEEAEKVFLAEGLMPEVAHAAAVTLAKSMSKEKDKEEKAGKGKGKGKKAVATPEAEGDAAPAGEGTEAEDDGKTQLAAISVAEIRAIANLIKKDFADQSSADLSKDLAKAIKKAAKDPELRLNMVGHLTPEIALFGRMMANSSDNSIFRSVESPLQMAHAFTTTAVEMDRDYWTGVDDLNSAEDDKTGAGMIEVRRFGSGVFYQFANLNLRQLFENLTRAFPFHEPAKLCTLARRLVLTFVDAFAMEQPTGYQTAFASLAAPDLLAFGLGEGQPVSAGAAFEAPLKSRNADASDAGGALALSMTALNAWVAEKQQRFGQRLVLPRLEGNQLPYDAQLAALDAELTATFERFIA